MKKFGIGLSILAGLIVLFLIIGEIVLPRETKGLDDNCEILQTDWYMINEDGSHTQIDVPSKIETPRGEDLTVYCILPEIPSAGYQLLIRSSQQDIYFYVDDELRYAYDTTDTRIWGSSSMSCNVIADVSDADSGKELKLVIRSTTSYSGTVNEVYLGTAQGIFHFLMHKYFIGVIVAIFLLFTSILTLIICIFLQRRYKAELPMTYAAWTGIVVSLQAIVESRLRQYYIGNMELAGSVSYLLLGLFPIALTLYINSTQRRRYEKVAKIFLYICFANEIINFILQLTGVQDLLASNTRSYILFGLSCVLCIITSIIDIKKGYFKETQIQVAGIMLAYLFGFGEIIAATLNFLNITGLMINFGMFLLLAAAILDSVRRIMKINAEKTEAIAASKAKSGFLANMSHEIRTPINSILGMNEMIRRESTEPEIVKYSNDVKDAGNNLLQIVNDILDFSKIESGKMEISEAKYSLSHIIHELVNLIKGRAKDNNLKLIVQVDEKLRDSLYGDDVRIKQVVLNLLTNAVKYTDKGSVTLVVSSADAVPYEGMPEDMTGKINLHIEVQDTGIGIKPEDMERLFGNFERLNLQHNRSVEGTGLGLSITMNLVKLMHGHLSVSSVYGKGSTFAVDIPQQLTENTALIGVFSMEEAAPKQAKVGYRESFHAPDAHILIVDDNDMNLKVIKSLLKKTELHIDVASSGMQCIDMCRKKAYDVVLMDHMMPDMDGIETYHKLLFEKLVDCPVVALTANAMSGMEEMYLKEGFNGYLSKPVKPDVLEKKLIALLPEDKVELVTDQA